MDLQLHFGDGSGSVSLEFHLVKNSKCVSIDHEGGGGGWPVSRLIFLGRKGTIKRGEKG